MDRPNWYFRQRVTNPEMKQFTDFIEEADWKNTRELLGNGILTGGNVYQQAPLSSQFVNVEQTIARDSRGRRVNVIDQFGDTASSIVLGLTLNVDGISVPNTNGTYILFTSTPGVEPFDLVGQDISISRSKFENNNGTFNIKQVVTTDWGGLIPSQIMVRIDEELDEDGYESGLSPRGTTSIIQVVSAQDTQANVAFNQLAQDIRPVNVGDERWVSLYATFDRNEFDSRLDGNADIVDYISLESFSFKIIEGSVELVGTNNRPALLNDGSLFLADIQHIAGQDITDAQIDIGRQSKMNNLPAIASKLFEYSNINMFGGKVTFTGTNVQTDSDSFFSMPNRNFLFTLSQFDIAIADGEVLYAVLDRNQVAANTITIQKTTRGNLPEDSVDTLVLVLAERLGTKVQGSLMGGELEIGESRDIGDSIGDAYQTLLSMNGEGDTTLKHTHPLTIGYNNFTEVDDALAQEIASGSSESAQDRNLKLIKGGIVGPTVIGGAQNEIQKLSYSIAPDGGDFILSHDGNDTPPLIFNASNAAIQTALNNLASLSGVIVTGDFNAGHEIEFAGADGGIDQPKIIITNNLTNGGEAIEVTNSTVQTGSASILSIPFSQDLYIQVPGLQDARNTILASIIVLALDGDCAYIIPNRDTGVDANLTIQYSKIDEIPEAAFIIARRIDSNRVIFGDNVLVEGQSISLGSSISEENKALIGVDSESQSDNDWSGKGSELKFIDSTDSHGQAIANIEGDLAKLFGQLVIEKHETDIDKARITGADKILRDGKILSQTMQNLIVSFEGAVIDFTNKQVFESDGVTPLGVDFPDLNAIPADEYSWVGVGIIPQIQDAQGRITAQVLLTPTNSSNLDENLATEAVVAGTIQRGAILLFNDDQGGSGPGLTVYKIRIFGPGSGAGGSGSGDGVGFESEMDIILNGSFFPEYTPIVFSQAQDDFANPLSDGSFSIVDGAYNLASGQNFTSINLFDQSFIDSNKKSLKNRLVVDWFDEASRDDVAIYEMSINGGVDWEIISMARQDDTTRYIGNITLADQVAFQDLRVRVTASDNDKKLSNIAVFYDEQLNGVISGIKNIQDIPFSGDDNQTLFSLTKFLPDPDLIKVYVVETGQAFVYPSFSINGYDIVFPIDTFNIPGESLNLRVMQIEGSSFDNSDQNANDIAGINNEIDILKVDSKNLLINGNFEFSQRKGFDASTTANDVYIPDRWIKNAGDSSEVKSNTGKVGFKTAYEVISSAGHNIQQRVETVFLDQSMLNKFFTFSIYIRLVSGTTYTPEVRIANATAKDNWAGQNIIGVFPMIGDPLSDEFQRYHYSFQVTQAMIDNGLYVRPGDFTDAVANTIQYAKAMLYQGTDIKPFERAGRNYAEEIDLCQRYFEKSYDLETPLGTVTAQGAEYYFAPTTFNNSDIYTIGFMRRKRAQPVGTMYTVATVDLPNTFHNTSTATNYNGSFAIRGTGSMVSVFGPGASLAAGELARFHWVADAEI